MRRLNIKTVLYLVVGGEIVALVFLAVSQFSLQAFITINLGMTIGIAVGLCIALAHAFREYEESRSAARKKFEAEESRRLQQHRQIERHFKGR